MFVRKKRRGVPNNTPSYERKLGIYCPNVGKPRMVFGKTVLIIQEKNWDSEALPLKKQRGNRQKKGHSPGRKEKRKICAGRDATRNIRKHPERKGKGTTVVCIAHGQKASTRSSEKKNSQKRGSLHIRGRGFQHGDSHVVPKGPSEP